MTHSKSAHADDKAKHGTAAMRSPEHIAKLLEKLAAAGTPVMTQLRESGQLFVSTIKRVEPQGRGLVVACSDNAAANTALLGLKSIVLQCRSELGQIEIPVGSPASDTLDGQPVICYPFPAILVVRQGRAEQRVKPVVKEPLHCVADEGGFLSFDALVVDVSTSGMGALIYDTGIQLTQGTVLRDCRISHPLGDVAGLDIEVLHVESTTLPDGRKAYRAGCRFVEVSPALAQLVNRLAGQPVDA